MKSVAAEWVRNPVYENWDIRGSGRVWHQVSFYQDGQGRGWAFEPLNLATRQKWAARQRAGYLAFLFREIRESAEMRGKPVNTTAVIRVNDDERDDPHVQYSLSALKNNADAIVDWMNPAERSRFLSERERVATSII
jgi:hypothetical protein